MVRTFIGGGIRGSITSVFILYLLLEALVAVFFQELGNAVYLLLMLLIYILYSVDLWSRLIRGKLYVSETLLFLLILTAVISATINHVSPYRGFQVSFFSLKFIPIYIILLSIGYATIVKIEYYIITVLLFEAALGFIQILLPAVNEWFTITLLPYEAHQYKLERLFDVGVTGTFQSKNVYGTLMNIAFALSFAHFQENRKKVYRICVVVFIIAVLISGSKINILLLLFFLVTYYRKNMLMLSSALLMFISLVITMFLYDKLDGIHFLSLFSKEYYEIAAEYGRLSLLSISSNIISDNIFLGIGAGNWGTGLSYASLREGIRFAEYDGQFILAGILQDNFWLSLASQFGMIYTFLFLFMIINIYRNSDRSYITKYIFYIMIGSSFVYPSFDMKIVSFIFLVYFALHYKRVKVIPI